MVTCHTARSRGDCPPGGPVQAQAQEGQGIMKRLFASAALVAVVSIGITVATAATASAAGGAKVSPKTLTCPTEAASAGAELCGSITIQNTGHKPLTTGHMFTSGDTGHFSPTPSPTCNFVTLNSGQSCFQQVTFVPGVPGTFSMTLGWYDSTDTHVLGKATIVGVAT